VILPPGSIARGARWIHAGGIVSYVHGVDSETGTLRTVLVHRPGQELKRMTGRTRDRLLFEKLPWVAGAQQEHDRLTAALRDQGIEVLYVTELLQDALEYQAARDAAIAAAIAALGDELAAQVGERLGELGPEDLAQVLIGGLAAEDLPGGRGLAYQLLRRDEFIVEPVPNLVFTRDSAFWVGDRPGVASLAAPHRRREADLLALIYGHHPRFSGSKSVYGPEFEPLDGGDVLLLAPGVLAVGVGQRTTAAGAERLASSALDAGLAHTVLAIPLDQPAGSGYLDTVCTVIDSGTVLMHPATAFTLTAHTLTAHSAGTRVSRPQPFLEAAARALGIERLNVIDAGPDDGGNALTLGPRLVLCHERSTEVIVRLEAAGVTVIRVPGSELASSRGGPRSMACPVGRDPAAVGQLHDRAEPGHLTARRSVPAAPATTVSPALDSELAPA
jgi:arginine deiminase